jgi:hypothetical protein
MAIDHVEGHCKVWIERGRSIVVSSINVAAGASARLAGIRLMLLSIFMFSFGDALGKFMVATYSVERSPGRDEAVVSPPV